MLFVNILYYKDNLKEEKLKEEEDNDNELTLWDVLVWG